MIDFRYHVVSLVSVFLALAVGVVLGAGPLRGEIADSLRGSVEQLGEERNQLRTDLNAAEWAVGNRDTFTREVTPALVVNRLAGERVAVIVLPGADGGDVDDLIATIESAGATVAARVRLDAAWTEPEAEDVRREAQDRLVPLLAPLALRADLDVGLARALLTDTPTRNDPAPRVGAERQADAATADPVSARIVEILDEEGLLSFRTMPTDRADVAVVVAPAVPEAANAVPIPTTPAGLTTTPSPATSDGAPPSLTGSASPTPPPTPTSMTASPSAAGVPTGWAAVAAVLDAASRGTVVTGPASSATDTGVLSAVRDDVDLAEAVSTVDTFGSPMGQVMVVMALEEQLAGGAGAYGFGRGADAVLPQRVITETVP